VRPSRRTPALTTCAGCAGPALPETGEVTQAGAVAACAVPGGRRFTSVTRDGLVRWCPPPQEAAAQAAAHPAGEPPLREGAPAGIPRPAGGCLRQGAERSDAGRPGSTAPRSGSPRHGRRRRPLPTVPGGEPARRDRPARATRALHGAGLATPEQVVRCSESELPALLGVGPKAVRCCPRPCGGTDRTCGPDRAVTAPASPA
jgi:hypothetical protein